MLAERRRHLRVEGNVAELAALGRGEDQRAAYLLYLLPDIDPAQVSDAVDGQAEDLTLSGRSTDCPTRRKLTGP